MGNITQEASWSAYSADNDIGNLI